MFVRSKTNDWNFTICKVYEVKLGPDSSNDVMVIDDAGDNAWLVGIRDEYEIINEEAPALQSAVKKPSTFELGQLVKILHSDYGDTVKAGQMRRVTEVLDHGIEITVFACDFNSDVQLFFTFDEVE